MEIYFIKRAADGATTSEITVSKSPRLPDGDFQITKYLWDFGSLWFVDSDNFTPDERQLAWREWRRVIIENLDKELLRQCGK